MIKVIGWDNKQGALIPSSMPHEIKNFTKAEGKKLLKDTGAYFIRWNSSFDIGEDNRFWYVIKESHGGLEELSKKMRNQVKRGLRHFYIELINPETMLDSLFDVYVRASERYSTFEKIMTKNEFYNFIINLDLRKYEFFGAFSIEDDCLVAYSQNLVESKCCFYKEMFFHPAHLKNYCSYALIFEMNKIYLNDRQFRYIHDGSRSLSHETAIHEFLISKFKFRKAFSKMEIRYRWDVKLVCFFLYPYRNLIYKINRGVLKKVSVLLRHEEIARRGAL